MVQFTKALFIVAELRAGMEEKRKSKRMNVNMTLEVSSLFKQDNVVVENIDAPIEIIDISRSGIGFYSKSNLPAGYYFNASIELGSDDAKLNTVVKIIRQEKIENGVFKYGCEFVGLAPVLSYIFDDYENELERNKNN